MSDGQNEHPYNSLSGIQFSFEENLSKENEWFILADFPGRVQGYDNLVIWPTEVRKRRGNLSVRK